MQILKNNNEAAKASSTQKRQRAGKNPFSTGWTMFDQLKAHFAHDKMFTRQKQDVSEPDFAFDTHLFLL